MAGVYGHTEKFQSTLSMRRATDRVIHQLKVQEISIHALHEESDYPMCSVAIKQNDFNPRSP